MDEKNINISKSEEELLEIMENRSHITADQLHNLKEDEECLQACSDLAEIVIEMQKKQNMLIFVILITVQKSFLGRYPFITTIWRFL